MRDLIIKLEARINNLLYSPIYLGSNHIIKDIIPPNVIYEIKMTIEQMKKELK